VNLLFSMFSVGRSFPILLHGSSLLPAFLPFLFWTEQSDFCSGPPCFSCFSLGSSTRMFFFLNIPFLNLDLHFRFRYLLCFFHFLFFFALGSERSSKTLIFWFYTFFLRLSGAFLVHRSSEVSLGQSPLADEVP